MKSAIYRFIMRKRLSAVKRTEELLNLHKDRVAIERWQIEAFNRVWTVARENVPFYQGWQRTYNLPDAIQSLSELNSWPVLTKADLRKADQFCRSNFPPPSRHIVTGGSTGEPVRLPTWGDPFTAIMQTIGRKAYGVQPGDRTVLLWGHEHLYGKGLARKVNAFKRGMKDWVANWKRISAYDLSEGAMAHAFAEMRLFKPKFIIGFSPAVLAFVRHNRTRAGVLGSVKVVLCTAGPLSDDEKREISAFFGAAVCMEYGSVDGGCMAYTRPSDGLYDVHWNTHLIQAVKDGDGNYRNILTRLTDCYVPIIRYDIGDCLELDERQEEDNTRSVLEMVSVKGRPSEMIHFSSGVSFFGALIGDCVKQVPEVIASQIAVSEDDNVLEVRVVADTRLSGDRLGIIKNRLGLTVSNLERIEVRIVQVDRLQTTVGGKVPRVVRLPQV